VTALVRLAFAVAASLSLSCGAGGPLPRETRASNARSDDPWLAGDACGPDDHEPPLPFEDLAQGVGAPVFEGMTVRVHYTAKTMDGTFLHDSRNDGPPVEIVIGSTKTICGLHKSVVGMKAGGQRRVLIPWRLAFGEAGRTPDIPPRTDLVFVIDLYLPADAPSEHGAPPANPIRGGGGMRRR
jgi:FKBP-type peptidyl-prolyl cis-trans isomerase